MPSVKLAKNDEVQKGSGHDLHKMGISISKKIPKWNIIT
jgi:hypothetical protein